MYCHRLRLGARAFTAAAAAAPTRIRAGSSPLARETKPGDKFSWCACGLSKRQPLCDGSHKSVPGAARPVRIEADKAETVWLCTCKATARADGRCDGAHLKLPPMA